MTTDPLSARLRAIFQAEMEDLLQALNSDLIGLETEPRNASRLGSLFRVVHTLKGAAQAAHVPAVEGICHVVESFLAQVRDGGRSLDRDAFSLLFGAADALAEVPERLREERPLPEAAMAALQRRLEASLLQNPDAPAPRMQAASASPLEAEASEPAKESLTGPEAAREHVRITADKLDALGAATGQLLLATRRVTATPAELEELHDLAVRLRTAWRRTSASGAPGATASDRSPVVRMTMETVELGLDQITQMTERLAKANRSDSRSLTQAADEVADRVLRIRLRPFEDACVALPRAVRDLAAANGKMVRLEISGREVQADRAVLDLLQEPLLHLVRNAVDHGIETPEERERAGKPRTGTITVSATLRGRRLLVSVSDDGRGPDVNAIRTQLTRRGLPLPKDDDLSSILFQSGFSTRETPSAISGRGVGLDAVRTTIERIRGTVALTWMEGEGTTFTIECPPSLSTMRAVLAAVGSMVVALPSVDVEHLARVRPDEIHRVEDHDMIITPSGSVPLALLADLLGAAFPDQLPGRAVPVIRMLVGGRRLAVAVDELIAEEEIVIQPLERVGRIPPLLSGAALLATGRVALVVNSAALVAAGLEGARPRTSLGGSPSAGTARKHVLLVDDSFTTRSLEESILQTAGYDVVTAADGAEAWELLQEQEFDIVVSDIEMPRMDGFQLCEAIRRSPVRSRLPIILVTALESSEHRARGMEVGADAYLPKSSFDQQDLLDAIQQFIGST